MRSERFRRNTGTGPALGPSLRDDANADSYTFQRSDSAVAVIIAPMTGESTCRAACIAIGCRTSSDLPATWQQGIGLVLLQHP